MVIAESRCIKIPESPCWTRLRMMLECVSPRREIHLTARAGIRPVNRTLLFTLD